MESQVAAVIILILLLGGMVALLARQRAFSGSLPALKASGSGFGSAKAGRSHDDVSGAAANALADPGLLSAQVATRPASGAMFPAWEGEVLPAAELPRPDIFLELPPILVDRLDQIDLRLDALQRAVERLHEELGRAEAESLRRFEVAEARREAAQERLRADLVLAVSGLIAEKRGGADRRAEVSAELYARLARFEAALSAVTNPVLLPGEPYAPPEEFATEALIWENWNEVGERAFALADAYSAQRLHLSDETRHDLSEFVTALRLLLTRSIYPNLHADADVAQRAALRTALDDIAGELPKVRVSLDREYREVRTP